MITVVLFLWYVPGTARRYGAAHVNAVVAMLAAQLRMPHRVVLVTDDGAGVRSSVTRVAIDASLIGRARYAKLMLFRPDAAQLFGGTRLLGLDLDVVAVNDLTPLIERVEDFVIWQDPLRDRDGYGHSHRYNSSMILMNAGCRPQVWDDFDPRTAPDQVRGADLIGSDQAWIGLTLGPHEPVWTQGDGVLGFKHDIGKTPDGNWARCWPNEARLIVCHGRPKPWELEPDHPLRLDYQRYGQEVVAV